MARNTLIIRFTQSIRLFDDSGAELAGCLMIVIDDSGAELAGCLMIVKDVAISTLLSSNIVVFGFCCFLENHRFLVFIFEVLRKS